MRAMWHGPLRPGLAKARDEPSKDQREQRQGHGGHVVKANDPHPVSLSAKPRCNRSCSGEDADGPEDPVNSREVSFAREGAGNPTHCEKL
jgi:hypothetical protein